MKLNTSERWLVNNPVRALVQRFYEVPFLRRLEGQVESGRVLEVGCGQGGALRVSSAQRTSRFSETEFLEALQDHELQPDSEIRRVLFGDIFIGVARRSSPT